MEKAQQQKEEKGITSKFLLRNTLDFVDIFQKPLPSFNMRGRTSVPSVTGGLFSFFIFLVMLLYATIKFMHLLQRHNPQVASFVESDALDSSDVFNFRDNGLKFAFGAEGFIDRTLKDDPRYVKTFARLYGHREGKLFEQFIPMHYCTNQDLEDFDEPTSESQGVFRSFKQDPDRKLFCLDWEKYGDILEIWGTENDEVNYQRFEYVVVPCNYVHAEIQPTDDFVAPECIADRDQQMAYLGNIRMVFLTTEQTFNQQEFGEAAIKQESRIFSQQVDQTKPTWIDGRLSMNLLEDEIALLQYGQSTEVEFFSYSLSENLPSAWINWPTPEEPTNKYKYVSIEFNMKLDKLNWQRATYSLLDWLGDLGGLLDILLHIGQVLVEPVAMFTLQASLMTNFFRFKESGSTQKVNDEEQTELDADLVEQRSFLRAVTHQFQANKRIPNLSFYSVNCLCNERVRNRRYKETLRKSNSRILKEMDLQKFLHRQRVYLSSLLGLLKGNQSAFVDKFSQLVIRESSEHAGTSDDDELSDWADRPLDFIKRMQRSKNHIDRRFLDIFKLRLQDQGLAEKTRFETREEVDLSQVPLQGIQEATDQKDMIEEIERRQKFFQNQIEPGNASKQRKRFGKKIAPSQELLGQDSQTLQRELNQQVSALITRTRQRGKFAIVKSVFSALISFYYFLDAIKVTSSTQQKGWEQKWKQRAGQEQSLPRRKQSLRQGSNQDIINTRIDRSVELASFQHQSIPNLKQSVDDLSLIDQIDEVFDQKQYNPQKKDPGPVSSPPRRKSNNQSQNKFWR